jgi:hypothetical protein
LEQRQPAFQVLLDDVDTLPRAREHFFVTDLDAISLDVELVLQHAQQAAVAAAQVEHGGTGLDSAGDRAEVRPQRQDVRIGQGVHAPISSAMRS